ncbi:MAG: DUF4956 domain-containing protein [Bacteroides sp.]|nr:DUF4956 domain-containing protein [Roseburia sp.]MCM1347237.1 DUF4956 domain-containing protein [Bacteroides sp.]MCM1421716.1 DUF4956 domain-containing protein [Bacteroides sp.]
MDSINYFLSVLTSDTCRLIDLLLRLIINTAFTVIIARAFYFPKSRRKDFFFTFILVGFCIFMLIHLMGDAKIKTGIAMGLFAIFCIMRYRTESVPIREMTYLFLVISLSAINALAWEADISSKHPEFLVPELTAMGELLLTDVLFALVLWIAERGKWVKGLASKYIKYDKIDLITPERHDELIADLKARTGLDITKAEIGSIDFLKDMALIKIYYNAEEVESDDELTKMPKLYS